MRLLISVLTPLLLLTGCETVRSSGGGFSETWKRLQATNKQEKRRSF